MRKLLAYPLTLIYFLFFGLTLLVFHPLQMLALNVFGNHAHKKVVDALQWSLVRCLHILGTRFSFINLYNISTDQPLIIVSNHQSMYDISPIMWFMRKHHVKFVSKKELGHGIPSVSYNLRHGGSALIDRNNPQQAIREIIRFSKYIEENNYAAVIFPEGTRGKYGTPKPFQTRGLHAMLKNIPSALVVPITINNSWKMLQYGKFPMGIGNHLKFKIHQPIKLSNFTNHEALIKNIENTIVADLEL